MADASSPDDTRELIAASINGDPLAFAELIRRHKDRIVRLVARFARTPADLDELAQDTFIKAHRSLHLYRGEAPFEHWLCRIATRCCQDYLRRLYRRRWFTSLDALRDEGFEPAHAHSTDPRVETLRLALRRLPPDQQTVLTLLELEGHSIRDIALFTGLSEANVKVRAHRARHALRAAFDLLTSSETPRPSS
jgi:RNA polymerase sigma-70 factor, ECF subfamily